MINPDPKQYKLRKLRGQGYILVDRQIIRRRKYLKKKGIELYPDTPPDALGCPRLNDQPVFDDTLQDILDYKLFE